MSIWNFIQNQILGMRWLNIFIEDIFIKIGVDISSFWVKSVQFFLYDVIKIVILLCFLIFIVSFLQSFFPPERSKKILSRFTGIKANILAALLGTTTPFCSCSSIPIFMGFTSAGLPLGVTFSFLISSPMVDLASVLLLVSIFGVRIAFIYVFFGLLIAIAGGLIIEKMKMQEYLEDYVKAKQKIITETPTLTYKDRLSYSKQQMVSTLRKVFPYILVGVGIGAIIHNWIPEEWVSRVLGSNNPFSIVIAVFAGIPIYADIFGTIPIAEALFYKDAQLGTILTFMMAVTTLSVPSLVLLSKAVKPKLLTVFIIICTVGILIVGYIFNLIDYFIL